MNSDWLGAIFAITAFLLPLAVWVTNLFGFADSRNSTPHIGYQRVANNSGFSYTDWSLGLGKATVVPGLKYTYGL